MSEPLRILLVEDNPADADLAMLEVQRAGLPANWQRVDTEAAFLAALEGGLDLILSDFHMPQFNGLRALELLKRRGLDVPFILISGTIGEDTAVEAMRRGAADYLLKDRLARLGPAVIHALAECRLRRERCLGMEALRVSEKRFKALFEQAAVGVAQTDARTGCFVQVNHRFCEITGRSALELEQLSFAAITHPDDVGRDLDVFAQMKSGLIREATREKRYLRKNGAAIWINLTVSAMWAPGEPPDFLIAVAQDVTASKQLEEQLRQTQKMEAIGTLAGGIAHDFNNILGAIRGYTELAQMRLKDNPVVRDYLESVLQAASRATDLVGQILTFSRRQPPERKPIQLAPVVAETLKLLRATIPASIEVRSHFAPDTPTVLADPTQIHQIVMNLGTNALHAMGEDTGRLEVTLDRCVIDEAYVAVNPAPPPGVYARLAVADNGCGMKPETAQRIFEPFFTTKPLGESTGLGLSVVHGIMESHDGMVTVCSELGRGTVFYLYFPAYAGVPSLPAAAETSVVLGHGERILFVDDEVLLAKLGQIALTALGYNVEVATQPDEALKLIRADPSRFALVITDQSMPGMTGLVLAANIKQIRGDLPVILTTGHQLSLTPERIQAAGIFRLLPKPTSIQALSAAVHAVW